MPRAFLIIIFLAINNFHLKKALSQNFRQYYRLAHIAERKNDHLTALYYYKKAIEKKQSLKLAYNLATLAFKNKHYFLAEKWFQYILQNDKKNKYIDVLFFLGEINKRLGRYQKALLYYHKFLQSYTNEKDYKYIKAKNEIISCEKVFFMTFEPKSYQIKNFTEINSEYSEYACAKYNDTLLFFVSYRPLSAVDSLKFYSKLLLYDIKNNNILTDPCFLNINKHVSSFSFNQKRDKLILSLCDSNYRCNLYLLEWGKNCEKKLLNQEINYPNSTTTTPFLLETDTATYLFFASDRENSIGGLDIWVIKVDTNFNPINKAINISTINSIVNECCPFFDKKEKKLYFSSQFFLNFGGYDIFYSELINNFNFSSPINLGYPLNSRFDELYFFKNNDNNSIFFSSNRTDLDTNLCCNDIFFIVSEKEIQKDTLLFISNKIDSLKKLLPIYLYFDNDEPNPKSMDTITTYSYDELYYSYIKKIDEYKNEYSKGFKNEKKEVLIREVEDFFTNEVIKNYEKLNYYLSEILKVLEKGETITLKIRGYASPLNTNDYNYNLSKRRISSFINYLTKYNNGVFTKYLQSNPPKLIIIREPLGESTAPFYVSDNLYNLRESVYSPKAAFERKIAIIDIIY